jgi:hypothetical protein
MTRWHHPTTSTSPLSLKAQAPTLLRADHHQVQVRSYYWVYVTSHPACYHVLALALRFQHYCLLVFCSTQVADTLPFPHAQQQGRAPSPERKLHLPRQQTSPGASLGPAPGRPAPARLVGCMPRPRLLAGAPASPGGNTSYGHAGRDCRGADAGGPTPLTMCAAAQAVQNRSTSMQDPRCFTSVQATEHLDGMERTPTRRNMDVHSHQSMPVSCSQCRCTVSSIQLVCSSSRVPGRNII